MSQNGSFCVRESLRSINERDPRQGKQINFEDFYRWMCVGHHSHSFPLFQVLSFKMVQYSVFVYFVVAAATLQSSAFVPSPSLGHSYGVDATLGKLLAKKADGDDAVQQNAFAVGTIVEFEEKNRVHVGKIVEQEHKSSGGARYGVVDHEGNRYGIPDKAVHFAVPAPNSPGAASKLFDEFCKAQEASEAELQAKLEISTELLEMAWEEAAEDDEQKTELTPSDLISLVHSRAASAIEKYMAWRLLKTEMAHVFFKELKDHGRVVAFKAKARKAVDAAKQHFCNSHEDSDLCLV